MFKRILVPVDGSPTSNKALTHALQLARQGGAAVRLLHVVDELMHVNLYADSPKLLEVLLEAARKALADASAIAQAAGVPADTRMLEKPGLRLGAAVAAEAAEWGADLVVLGTHGRKGFDRLMLGSGAEQVIRMAVVPVLVVRDDAQGASGSA